MSLPEALLWQAVRKGKLKFRRQHACGPYILDFYCSDARLAIEVDGQAHERGKRPAKDVVRDRWLRGKGIETLRLPPAEVLKDGECEVRSILAEAKARLPLHHPAGGPPPRGELGEDF